MIIINSNAFWTAFAAIGSTIGALATTAAVIIALWQTKLHYKKILKVSFIEHYSFMSETDSEVYRFVGLSVTNIGNRITLLHGWGFSLVTAENILLLPDRTPMGKLVNVKVPHRLDVEEAITFGYNKASFYELIQKLIDQNLIEANKKIKCFVMDSTGKAHYTYTNKTAEKLLSSIRKELDNDRG